MKIIMLTSEIAPFAKTGGLGDVVASLSAELVREGHEVFVFLPHYTWIDTYKKTKHSIKFLHGFGSDIYSINSIEDISHDRVNIILLKNDSYFDRTGIYSDGGNKAYDDNIVRFSSFTRASLEAINKLEITPDVVHLHDWAPGLACLYMKNFYKETFAKVRTILTIHNIGYQGIYGASEIHSTHLTKAMLPENACDNTINFLKIAVSSADKITTVSPTYAKEIQTAEFGHGLEEILKFRKKDLHGILNGVDYNQWNPENDSLIPAKYSSSAPGNKQKNRDVLLNEAGMKETSEKIPVFGMITRLAEQKGIELLFRGPESALRQLLEKGNMRFIVLGTGEQWCEQELKKLDREYENFTCFIEFSNERSHLVEAGCDFFLMPSRYEPCGLNQIYSLKYGTVPVVRKTGGLADTIIDESLGPNANGIVFEDYSVDAIVQSVQRAAELFSTNNKRYSELQKNGMNARFTWEKSVHEYCEVYKSK